MKLHFAEEILLLLLHDENGKFARVPDWSFRFSIAGAQLMELAIHDRIDTDLECLTQLSEETMGQISLDRLLRDITQHGDKYDARYWLERVATDAETIREEMLQSLIDRGILESREGRMLWVFKSRRYPLVDGTAEREVKLRIMEVLYGNKIPDPHDIALIALADACGLLRLLLSERAYERIEPRVAQVRQMDLIGRAMIAAINEIEVAMATASQSQFY